MTMAKKYIILDTESNGVACDAEVWQIAWTVTDCRFEVVRSDGGYLAPTKRMATKAKDITGLDRKTLTMLAEPADGLYKRLLKALCCCSAVIGHSIDMDLTRIINDARARCTVDVAQKVDAAIKSIPAFDTMFHTIVFVAKKRTRAMWYHGQFGYIEELAYPSLVELAKKLGVDFTGICHHTADGDVELTRRCMAAMKANHRELVRGLYAKKPTIAKE